MRLPASIAIVALCSLVSSAPLAIVERQNTDQYGTAQVSPATFRIHDEVTVIYDGTNARFPPQYIDFYLQGQFPSIPGAAELTPLYLLSRNAYPSGENTFVLKASIPQVPTSAVNWHLFTDVIFPGSSNGTLEVGSIPVSVTISPD